MDTRHTEYKNLEVEMSNNGFAPHIQYFWGNSFVSTSSRPGKKKKQKPMNKVEHFIVIGIVKKKKNRPLNEDSMKI